MNKYFKNIPRFSITLGIVTSVLICCAVSTFIQTLEFIDAKTSMMGWTMEKREDLLTLPLFAIGTVVFGFLRWKLRRNIYTDIENRLDD